MSWVYERSTNPISNPNPCRESHSYTWQHCVRFEITEMTTKSKISCTIMPSGSEIARRFRRIYRLHLQGRKLSQANNQHKQLSSACRPLFSGFLLGLLFDPEEVGNLLPRNVWLYLNYKVWQYRRPYSTSIWHYVFMDKYPLPNAT
jgi:plasmid stabilization system protein ParE